MQYFTLGESGGGLVSNLNGEDASAALLNLKKITHPAAMIMLAIMIAFKA